MSTGDRPHEPRRIDAAREPLVGREWRLVAWAAVAPVLLTALVVSPLAVTGRWTWGEVVWSAVVFGGLLSLAAGFVVVDRLQALRCIACGRVNLSSARVPTVATTWPRCRWRREERHGVFIDPGLCDCGRRLHRWNRRGVWAAGPRDAASVCGSHWSWGSCSPCSPSSNDDRETSDGSGPRSSPRGAEPHASVDGRGRRDPEGVVGRTRVQSFECGLQVLRGHRWSLIVASRQSTRS